MTLSGGKAPLGPDRLGWFNADLPEGLVYVEPYRRRVRGIRGGRTVVDSERVLLVHRPTMPWYGYVFPADDVGDDLPVKPEPEVPGHVRVRWDAIDQWLEEDEPVLGHPKNPYHRVDCARTSRRLRAEVAGTTLVDTDRTVAVFETALDPRLYVSREHVRTDLLVASETTTFCPYKGTTTYWSAVIDGQRVDDVAWCYDDPLPTAGCELIRGHISFEESRAEVRHDLPRA